MRTELGKISKAEFGMGGYDNCMIGLSLSFTMKCSGVSNFDGAWGIPRTKYSKWTEESRIKCLGETVMRLADILTKAKCKSVSDLVGVPVELVFDGLELQAWRVLEEFL